MSSVLTGGCALLQKGNKLWSNLECPESVVFPWDHKSTYIRPPAFFHKLVSVYRPMHDAAVFNSSYDQGPNVDE